MTYLLTDDEAAKVREALEYAAHGEWASQPIYAEACAILDNAKQDPLQALTDLTQEMGLYEEAQPAPQQERKKCVKCNQTLVSDFTDTCYSCNNITTA